MKPESRIKAILIDHLIRIGFLDNTATIISEYKVSGNIRRVDLAIFKSNRAYAFEIKSKNDSLKRLDGQIADLSKLFDKTIVVAEPHHIDKIITSTPKETAIWIAEGDSIKKIRRGKLSLKKIQSLNKLDRSLKVRNRFEMFEKLAQKHSKKMNLFWRARTRSGKTSQIELAAIIHGIPKPLKKPSNMDIWKKLLTSD